MKKFEKSLNRINNLLKLKIKEFVFVHDLTIEYNSKKKEIRIESRYDIFSGCLLDIISDLKNKYNFSFYVACYDKLTLIIFR